MKVKLKPIRAFEALAPSGEVVARLFAIQGWEGMLKLVGAVGETLIIERPSVLSEDMARALGPLGGDLGQIECDVIKASPSLLHLLIQKVDAGGAAAVEHAEAGA